VSRRDTPSIVEFVTDPQLLGLSISPAQETLLRATYGLPLTEEQFGLWRRCTGREMYPATPFGETTDICGARGGKTSRYAAPILAYEAIFGQHEQHLGRGERCVFPLVAQDSRGTRVAFGYVRDYLTGSPLLSRMIEEVYAAEIRLSSGSLIDCFACTLRALRAVSIPCGVLDELGFYRLEGSADADGTGPTVGRPRAPQARDRRLTDPRPAGRPRTRP